MNCTESEPNVFTDMQLIPTRKFLVVSFHDLAPHSQPACAQVLSELRHTGVGRVSLLVTPNWYDSEPVENAAGFMNWLADRQQEGHEICLHGFNHRAESVKGGLLARWMGRVYTVGEGEFYQIGLCEARRRIEEGLAVLRSNGMTITGFVPPAWLLSAEGRTALVESGLLYCTRLQTIDLLQAGETIYAPTLVYSCRNGWRRAVSLRWVRLWSWINRNTPVLRLAVHPVDWNYPAVRQSVIGLAQYLSSSREVITYAELAKRWQDE